MISCGLETSEALGILQFQRRLRAQTIYLCIHQGAAWRKAVDKAKQLMGWNIFPRLDRIEILTRRTSQKLRFSFETNEPEQFMGCKRRRDILLDGWD